MSDTQDNGAGGNGTSEQAEQAGLVVNGQYLKDLSFESPNSPGILADLQKGVQPDVNINVNVSTAKLEGPETPGNMHEVVLELNAELKVGDQVGFICELKYGGVFTISVPEEHVKAFSLIECPRILFPFARQIMAEATQNGGFMPLMLQPIDFAAMYQKGYLEQQAATKN